MNAEKKNFVLHTIGMCFKDGQQRKVVGYQIKLLIDQKCKVKQFLILGYQLNSLMMGLCAYHTSSKKKLKKKKFF